MGGSCHAAFQAPLFIVGRIFLFGFCSPFPITSPTICGSVRPEPQGSEGRWQLGSDPGSGQATPGWREMGFSASEDLIFYQEARRKPREELRPKEGLRLRALTRAVNDIQ